MMIIIFTITIIIIFIMIIIIMISISFIFIKARTFEPVKGFRDSEGQEPAEKNCSVFLSLIASKIARKPYRIE